MRTRSREPIGPRDWCSLFLRRCGLTFRDAQVAAMLRLVDEQMRARGITDPAVYHALLSEEREGSIEWNELLEGVLNHETSFFRHPASFDALRSIILPDLLNQRVRGAYLSFWSAGCSTGQETYSLAMLAMADEAIAGRLHRVGRRHQPPRDRHRPTRPLRPAGDGRPPPAYRQRFLRPVDRCGASTRSCPSCARACASAPSTWSPRRLQPESRRHLLPQRADLLVAEAGPRVVTRSRRGFDPAVTCCSAPARARRSPPGLEPLHVAGVRMFRRKPGRPEVRS